MTLFKDLGRIIKTITDSILAIPIAAVAETLNITEGMVKEAKDAGCKTYEEIREYFKNN